VHDPQEIGTYARFRSADEPEAMFWSSYAELSEANRIGSGIVNRSSEMEARARLAYSQFTFALAQKVAQANVEDLVRVKDILADSRRAGELAYDSNKGLAAVRIVRPSGNPTVYQLTLPKGLGVEEAKAQVTLAVNKSLESSRKSIVSGTRSRLLLAKTARAEAKLEKSEISLAAQPPPGRGRQSSSDSATHAKLRQAQRDREADQLAIARRAYLAEPNSRKAQELYAKAQRSGVASSPKGSSQQRLGKALHAEASDLSLRIAKAKSAEERARLVRMQAVVLARARGIPQRSFAEGEASMRQAFRFLDEELEQAYRRNPDVFPGLSFQEVKRDPALRPALRDLLERDQIELSAETFGSNLAGRAENSIQEALGGAETEPRKLSRMADDLGALAAKTKINAEEVNEFLKKRGWLESEISACGKSGLCASYTEHLAMSPIPPPSLAKEALLEVEMGAPLVIALSKEPESAAAALREIQENINARRKALVSEIAKETDGSGKMKKVAEAFEKHGRALEEPAERKQVLELLELEQTHALHGALINKNTGESTALGVYLRNHPTMAKTISKTPAVAAGDASQALKSARDFLNSRSSGEIKQQFLEAGLSEATAAKLAAHSLKEINLNQGSEVYRSLRAFAREVSQLGGENRFRVFEAVRNSKGAKSALANGEEMRAALKEQDRALAGRDSFSLSRTEVAVSDAILHSWNKEDLALCRAISACGFDGTSQKEILAKVRSAKEEAKVKLALAQTKPGRAPASVAPKAVEKILATESEIALHLEGKLDGLANELRASILENAKAMELNRSAAQVDEFLHQLIHGEPDAAEILRSAYGNAARIRRKAEAKGKPLTRSEALDKGLEKTIVDALRRNGELADPALVQDMKANALLCLRLNQA